MYNYKIENTHQDNFISIPLIMTNKRIYDDVTEFDLSPLINPIENFEKDNYMPTKAYTMNFNFYSEGGYDNNWVTAGYKSLDNNGFKKSLILLEFFDSDKHGENNFLFSSSLGVKQTKEMGPIDKENAMYQIASPKNDNYYIYFFRDLLSSKMTLKDGSIGGETKKYTDIYFRASLLNASNGKIVRFSQHSTTQNVENLDTKSYYYNLKMYETHQYVLPNNLSGFEFYEVKIV